MVTISEIDPKKTREIWQGLPPICEDMLEKTIAWIKTRQHYPARPSFSISDEFFRYPLTAI